MFGESYWIAGIEFYLCGGERRGEVLNGKQWRAWYALTVVEFEGRAGVPWGWVKDCSWEIIVLSQAKPTMHTSNWPEGWGPVRESRPGVSLYPALAPSSPGWQSCNWQASGGEVDTKSRDIEKIVSFHCRSHCRLVCSLQGEDETERNWNLNAVSGFDWHTGLDILITKLGLFVTRSAWRRTFCHWYCPEESCAQPQISSKQSGRTSSTKWEPPTLGKKTKWFSVDAHESCLFEGSAVLLSVAPGRNDGV